MELLTASMAEAKTNLSKIAASANRTGRSVVVMKNSKPWVEIRPLAYEGSENEANANALAEAEQIKADPDHERFNTAKDFFASLGI